MPERASTSTRNPVKSEFVPPFALQGQEFSCHVSWEPSTALSNLEIDFDDEIEVVHLYNVEECSLAPDAGGHSVRVTSFQEPGYFGFVLRSKIRKQPEVTARVHVRGVYARLPQPVFDRTFEIDLFRPDLVVEDGRHGARTLHFAMTEGSVTPVADNPVGLANRGKGTCVVLVSVEGDSSLRVGDYLQQDEAKVRFLKSLHEGLDSVRKSFPEQASIVNQIEEFAAKGIMTEDEALEGVKVLNEQLTSLEKDNPEFTEDLGDAIGEATLSIMSVDQRFSSWATAIGANVDRRIIMLNPWFAFEVGPEPGSATFNLRCFDLQWHEHNRLKVGPLTMTSDSPELVPICGIFQPARTDGEPACEGGAVVRR